VGVVVVGVVWVGCGGGGGAVCRCGVWVGWVGLFAWGGGGGGLLGLSSTGAWGFWVVLWGVGWVGWGWLFVLGGGGRAINFQKKVDFVLTCFSLERKAVRVRRLCARDLSWLYGKWQFDQRHVWGVCYRRLGRTPKFAWLSFGLVTFGYAPPVYECHF